VCTYVSVSCSLDFRNGRYTPTHSLDSSSLLRVFRWLWFLELSKDRVLVMALKKIKVKRGHKKDSDDCNLHNHLNLQL